VVVRVSPAGRHRRKGATCALFSVFAREGRFVSARLATGPEVERAIESVREAVSLAIRHAQGERHEHPAQPR
jgi:hypothetical protein